MSPSSSFADSPSASSPAFSSWARDCAFTLASRLCIRLHAAAGMAGFLNGKPYRTSSRGPSPAFAAAFTAAKLFIPNSDFLTAPDVLDDSAVSFICAVFDLPGFHGTRASFRRPSCSVRSFRFLRSTALCLLSLHLSPPWSPLRIRLCQKSAT